MAFTDVSQPPPEGPTPPQPPDTPPITGAPIVPVHPIKGGPGKRPRHPLPPPPRNPGRPTPPPKKPGQAPPPKRVNSARALLEDFLNQFGLGQLADWAWKTYKSSGGGDIGMKMVQAEMHTQPAFKTRFPAYDQLAKAGRAMSPAEMLQYEQAARQTMRAAGLPPTFYDQPSDFGNFMVNDVSVNELQSRVQLAQNAVIESPPEVRAQLNNLYGVHEGDLTAYFLDPTKALPIVQQKFTTAQIAGAGIESGFGQLSRGQAEGLTQLGVTADQARQGLGTLGTEKGLFENQVAGETQIGTDEQLSAQFSNNAAAQLRIKKRQEARAAAFGGSSGTNIGTKGVAALATGQT